MRTLSLLGSTGSIGRQALEVVDSLAGTFPYRVLAMTAGRNVPLFREQARKYRPEVMALADPSLRSEVAANLGEWGGVIEFGPPGLLTAARAGADVVLNAVVGVAGLAATLAALEAGSAVALANKESLVAGGPLIAALLDAGAGPLIPVDSEPSAVLQCLGDSGAQAGLAKIILTASGGPFRGYTAEGLAEVTRDQALAHPTWKMGPKITVDSATLMNKGLEAIEMTWLFRVKPEQVEVVIHPQSIIHSMVELVDGSILAQLSPPDMRLPIQFALTYPRRVPAPWPRYDPVAVGPLTFERPDLNAFRCLHLAYEAAKMKGTASAVLNAANEVAVQSFLDGRLAFAGIAGLVQACLDELPVLPVSSLDDVLAADAAARRLAVRLVGKLG
ncbi:MAG TPA: 1-deoxy-D-xylulose-5-phosphate reductoisomerase [Clostridiales bacterium]|nr:1-deoxy-D-xylulose-5-phosphate reductoisomerase [Clostridiales bacterium]